MSWYDREFQYEMEQDAWESLQPEWEPERDPDDLCDWCMEEREERNAIAHFDDKKLCASCLANHLEDVVGMGRSMKICLHTLFRRYRQMNSAYPQYKLRPLPALNGAGETKYVIERTELEKPHGKPEYFYRSFWNTFVENAEPFDSFEAADAKIEELEDLSKRRIVRLVDTHPQAPAKLEPLPSSLLEGRDPYLDEHEAAAGILFQWGAQHDSSPDWPYDRPAMNEIIERLQAGVARFGYLNLGDLVDAFHLKPDWYEDMMARAADNLSRGQRADAYILYCMAEYARQKSIEAAAHVEPIEEDEVPARPYTDVDNAATVIRMILAGIPKDSIITALMNNDQMNREDALAFYQKAVDDENARVGGETQITA